MFGFLFDTYELLMPTRFDSSWRWQVWHWFGWYVLDLSVKMVGMATFSIVRNVFIDDTLMLRLAAYCTPKVKVNINFFSSWNIYAIIIIINIMNTFGLCSCFSIILRYYRQNETEPYICELKISILFRKHQHFQKITI